MGNLGIMHAEGFGKKIHVVMSQEAAAFVRSHPLGVQKKIAYNIRKLEFGLRDKTLFKKLDSSEIWEIRTIFEGICYRLFAFWDTDMETLVVVTHGIVKKSQKTPKKEVQKAEHIRTVYFNAKRNNKWTK